MIYYGLSLGVNDLAGGPYLNLFLSGNALNTHTSSFTRVPAHTAVLVQVYIVQASVCVGFVEFPGYIVAVLVLDRLGRKLPLAVFNIVGGLACIAMACVPSGEFSFKFSTSSPITAC